MALAEVPEPIDMVDVSAAVGGGRRVDQAIAAAKMQLACAMCCSRPRWRTALKPS
jgi:hypothetical protein